MFVANTLYVVQNGGMPAITDLKDDVELGIEVRLEALALQDGLELVQELEGVLDGRDVLEALVDERLRENKVVEQVF